MQALFSRWFPADSRPGGNGPSSATIQYRLALSPAAALDRIAASIEEDGEEDGGGRPLAERGEFLGRVQEDHFRIWRNPARGGANNPFAPGLFGLVTAAGSGSHLQAGFRTRPFVRFFMAAWFASTVLFVLVALVVGLGQLASGHAALADLYPTLALLLLPIFGLAILRWGVAQGRGDRRALQELVERIFDDVLEETGPEPAQPHRRPHP